MGSAALTAPRPGRAPPVRLFVFEVKNRVAPVVLWSWGRAGKCLLRGVCGMYEPGMAPRSPDSRGRCPPTGAPVDDGPGSPHVIQVSPPGRTRMHGATGREPR